MDQILNPNLYIWNRDVFFHGIAGTLIIVTGLMTVYKERGTRVSILYLLYTFSLSGWVLALSCVLMSVSESNALLYSRLGNFSIAILPAAFLHISKVLLNLEFLQKWKIKLIWSISIGFSILALTSNQFVQAVYHYPWGYYGSYGPIGTIFIVYFTILIFYTVYQYIPVSRLAKPDSKLRKRAALLFRSFLVGLLGMIDFLPAFGINVFPFGSIFILSLFFLSTYVTLKYRLADISVEYAADNIINLISSPIVVFDMDNELRMTNKAAEELFKSTNKEMILDTLLSYLTKSNDDMEFILHTYSGPRCFDLKISPLLSVRKKQIANIFLLNDISQQKKTESLLTEARNSLEDKIFDRTLLLETEIEKHKQTEQALLLAKNFAESASQAKSIFLSRISHEFRTPLNALLGFTQILKMDYQDTHSDEHLTYINQMLTAGEHLQQLIENILDLSQVESSTVSQKLQPIDISLIVSESITLVSQHATAKGITFKIDLTDCNDILVIADETRLRQILIHLVNNAIKYNRENGLVTITCELGEKFILKISDTGPGISKENQEKIFEPFERISDWRHHTEGAGIGLTLARQFARQMNGDLKYSGDVNSGSSFYLELPLAES